VAAVVAFRHHVERPVDPPDLPVEPPRFGARLGGEDEAHLSGGAGLHAVERAELLRPEAEDETVLLADEDGKLEGIRPKV
jgi:hypothetical protein